MRQQQAAHVGSPIEVSEGALEAVVIAEITDDDEQDSSRAGKHARA